MAGCILDYSVGVVTNAPIVKQFYRELRGCASTSPITALSSNWANDVHPSSILRPLGSCKFELEISLDGR